jgi:hypothetical protein
MIVIFHSQNGTNHCDDGFGAAWVFWRKFGDKAEFWPGVYGSEPPLYEAGQCQGGQTFALVDFSYKRPQMKALARNPVNLLVLDHHKTAEAELDGIVDELVSEEPGWPMDEFGQFIGLPDIRFDMDRSGARMAWDYCFPGEDPPDLLLRIEDADLWRWHYEDGKAVQAALRSYPQTFEVWTDLMLRPIGELATEGASIRRFIEAKVAELKRTAWLAEIGGVQMPVCNAPWFLASELAGALAEEHHDGRAAVYFDQGKRRVFSLRARGDADVSEIAKRYGGGGHRSAAGFEVPRP